MAGAQIPGIGGWEEMGRGSGSGFDVGVVPSSP